MENNVDKQYQALLQDILDNGIEKKDRTGTGTLSVFGRQLRFNDIEHNFPILTTKKMPFKTIVTELLWFLRGDTNIQYLVQNGCNIWNGDAYKRYEISISFDNCVALNPQAIREGYAPDIVEPLSKEEFINKIKTDNKFAKTWGELGPIYGKQWRNWKEGKYTTPLGLDGPSIWEEGIDQIANLINELKTNPDSRRLMVSAWNVGELDQMVLPPCHYGFQLYTKEKEGKRYLSLMWNQRSVDTFLGLPFNITSYALLLRIIAKEVDMIADELIANLGDTHLYTNHIEQAKEQIGRDSFELPTLKILDSKVDDIAHYEISDFELHNYQSHQTIKAPLSN